MVPIPWRRASDHHSSGTFDKPSRFLTDRRSGRKPWESPVLFEGLFYFHPGFLGKGAWRRCPEDSRGPIRRAWAKLAQKAGAGFTVPWNNKKGIRDFGWNIFPFIWIFFLHFVSTLASEGIYLNWKDDQGVRRVMAQRVRRAIPPKKKKKKKVSLSLLCLNAILHCNVA